MFDQLQVKPLYRPKWPKWPMVPVLNSGFISMKRVVEVSFRSRVRRKAKNFVEFRRQVFALLLHNTVKRCFPSKPGMHRCFRKGSVHVHNHMVLQVTK